MHHQNFLCFEKHSFTHIYLYYYIDQINTFYQISKFHHKLFSYYKTVKECKFYYSHQACQKELNNTSYSDILCLKNNFEFGDEGKYTHWGGKIRQNVLKILMIDQHSRSYHLNVSTKTSKFHYLFCKILLSPRLLLSRMLQRKRGGFILNFAQSV